MYLYSTLHYHNCYLNPWQVSHCEEDCLERARIIALRAKVDPDLHNEMQCFLKRASTDCDLMNFYQTFVKCSEHVLERRTTLNKLKVSLIRLCPSYIYGIVACNSCKALLV